MIRPGQALLLIVTGLLVLGVIAVHSAGLSVGREEGATLQGLLFDRTPLLAAMALLALFVGMLTPIDRLESPKLPWIPTGLVVLSLLLLVLVQIPGIGREVHGDLDDARHVLAQDVAVDLLGHGEEAADRQPRSADPA